MPNAHRWVARGRPSKPFVYGSSPSVSLSSLNALSMPTPRPARPRTFSQTSLACLNGEQSFGVFDHVDNKKWGRSFTSCRFGSYILVSLFAFAVFIFVALISRNIDSVLAPSRSYLSFIDNLPYSHRADHLVSSNSSLSLSPPTLPFSLSSPNVPNGDTVLSNTLTPTSSSGFTSAVASSGSAMQAPMRYKDATSSLAHGLANDGGDRPVAAVGQSTISNQSDDEFSNESQSFSSHKKGAVGGSPGQSVVYTKASGHPEANGSSPMPPTTKDWINDSNGVVSWTRSWPLTRSDDHTGLYALQKELKFDNTTLLDYFHLHKTGGITTKVALLLMFNRDENKKKRSKRGDPLRVMETCYESTDGTWNSKLKESQWRCDFRQIQELSRDELRLIDLLLGHQYLQKGTDYLFGSFRDVRYFSVFRHPLSRKLSFYYHFYVRNEGRNENDVKRDEIMKFVNDVSLENDPRLRDGGPNYYATRFLSDGNSTFNSGNQFHPAEEEKEKIIKYVSDVLNQRFVFAGLQAQSRATNCMLEKLVQVFVHAHGIDDWVGTTELRERSHIRLNSGGYPWTAERLWNSMTASEKDQFRQVERVDLAIYEAAVQKFRRDVDIFSCGDAIDEEAWEEERFE